MPQPGQNVGRGPRLKKYVSFFRPHHQAPLYHPWLEGVIVGSLIVRGQPGIPKGRSIDYGPWCAWGRVAGNLVGLRAPCCGWSRIAPLTQMRVRVSSLLRASWPWGRMPSPYTSAMASDERFFRKLTLRHRATSSRPGRELDGNPYLPWESSCRAPRTNCKRMGSWTTRRFRNAGSHTPCSSPPSFTC